MLVFILACVVSFFPFLFLYLWLRNRLNNDEAYRKLCDQYLKQGALCIFPVVLMSAVSSILLRLTGLHTSNPLLHKALYYFIVLALMEEIAKFLAFKQVTKKNDYPYSWLDVTVFMTIVGIGFGSLESVVYAIGASVPVVLIRGICMPHAGYGYVTGYFYGKGLKNNNSAEKWLGFLLSWLMHGLYDFSLSEEFLAINDNLVFVPFILALLEIVFVIRLVILARKAKKQAKYNEPLLKQ